MKAAKDLAVLEASGLVSIAALQPELEYMFRHALLQDAAYGSLLKQERRELHRRVARALDELYPDRRDELAGVVALHLEQAGDAEAAAERYVAAGDHALARHAKTEARALFERALALIVADDARPASRQLRVRAIVGSTRAGWTFVPPGEAAERIGAVLADAEATGDIRLIGQAHFWNAFLRRQVGETVETSPGLRRSLARARELAQQSGDAVGIAMTEAFNGASLVLTGKMREGTAILEEHLPIIESQGDPLSAALLNDLLTLGYARLGDFASAERSVARAERLARDGDPLARLDVTLARAQIAGERGESAVAIELGTSCARDSDALGAPACAVVANLIVGTSRLRLEDAASARPPLERGYQLSTTVGLPPLRNLTGGMLAGTVVRLGDRAQIVGWDEALAGARALADRYGEATILAERAASRMRSGDPADDAIMSDLATAVRLFEAIEARPALARAPREQARALDAAGPTSEADAARSRAAGIEKDLGIAPRTEHDTAKAPIA